MRDIHAGKIALFLPSLYGGGAERAMLDVATGLAQRGLSVDMVLVKAEGQYVELAPEYVRLVDLGSHRIAASLPKLLRYLRRERPAVVLSTLAAANVVALTAKLLMRGRFRLVVRQENALADGIGRGTFKERQLLRALRVLLPAADGVVAVSRGVAEELCGLAPAARRKVVTIENPVVWPDHAEKAAAPVEHLWFEDAETPVILAVGRLAPAKDQATLLRAFARVVRSQPVRLVILGEGPERRNLLRLAEELGISEHVDLPGFRVNPFAYMSKSRLLAHSSKYEGFPNVLVQAMACGTPVVSTDCRHGPGEILEGGKWGRLAPVGDAEAMAEAIVETLKDPIEPGSLVSRAGVYSAEAAIDRYMRVVAPC